MKSAKIALALFLVSGTAVLAESPLDTDGDGYVTLEEIVAVYPDYNVEDFAEADTDSDGMLNEDELAVAAESGLLPATE